MTTRTARNTRTAPARIMPGLVVVHPGRGPVFRPMSADEVDASGAVTLETLSVLVGGYVTTAGRLDLGRGRGLDVFAHDDGLLLGLDWNASIDGADPVCGPLVVAIGDDEGETRPLDTARDLARAMAWVERWRRCVAAPSLRHVAGVAIGGGK